MIKSVFGAGHGFVSLALRRIAIGAVTLTALSAFIFFATQALPGDAAKQVLGPFATPEQVLELRHRLGLDRPVLVQYWDWVSSVARGNLGVSLTNGNLVADQLAPKIWASAWLVVLAASLSVPVAILIAISTAVRRNSVFEMVTSFTMLLAASLPEFVIGIGWVTLLATTVFQVFPPVSLLDPGRPMTEQLEFLAMPVLTLAIASVPYIQRMMHVSMIEVLDSQYITTARLNGVSERSVIFRHALRNAAGPAVQVIALTLAYLTGGVVVVEAVFNYPGIGTALVEAVRYRDIPVVQFLVLLIGSIYITCNIVSDMLVILLTPRLRTSL
jgi:peptide/nickel transport system permease protein